MDAGGACLGSPPPRLDTDRRKTPERALYPGSGTGLTGDGQGLPGCGLKAAQDRDISCETPEARKGQNGHLLGSDTDHWSRRTDGPGGSLSQGPEEADDPLPIMDWEALENHIAGLQLKETERRARDGGRVPPVEPPPSPTGRRRSGGARRLVSWLRADSTAWKAMGTSIGCESRFHSRMNLQLCFINDSSSESDAEESNEVSAEDPTPQLAGGEASEAERALAARRKELEREAKRSLALVKRQLDQEKQRQREITASSNGALGRGQTLDPSDLWDMSVLQLQELQTSVFSQIHRLNTQLMELLEVRDDLKTEQDAMLVEIGDLTH
ncbi:schwannomin-interacting protein 1-like [Pristis pectinata]|uniref:schwannomin-interacting protein 1-like n=1 Tax=Pristis pectinata TaxID=685728 RepID=UPI00223D4067|nr:schwannomin-interacting protein 1-like [Pristis pectinata]